MSAEPFYYGYSDRDGDKLEVRESLSTSGDAMVLVTGPGVRIKHADALRVAQAILAAAKLPHTLTEPTVDAEPETGTNEPQPRYGVLEVPSDWPQPSRQGKLVQILHGSQAVVEVASGAYADLVTLSARLNGDPIPSKES